MRSLRNTYETALDRVGRGKEALEIYESLGREALDSAELALNFGRALYVEGRKKDAEAILERGVTSWPENIALHSALARVRALRGEGENATALMEAEIRKRPTDLGLRFACADALHRAQHPQKALAILSEALRLAPDTPALLTALGIVLDELDRPLDGLQALRRVVELEPNAPVARRNLLSTLIRAGQADEALAIARILRKSDADDQFLIANEALALRVLGDPAYRMLYDYDRLVRAYEIPAPRGFFTTQNFNASLAEVLRREHKTNAHPLDQYMHNGSQTGRSLLNASEPTLAAFTAAIEGAVRDYVSRLQPNAADPVGRRRTEKVRYASLWSARLTNEGYQPNHVHDRGWISSAYYVSVLPNERLHDVHAGHLKLGEPNRPAAGCGPERFIEPEVGKLVLFPSYMWHGTVPFEGSERLSLAFDVLPA
jgi:Flp pilus assembly protein TadD